MDEAGDMPRQRKVWTRTRECAFLDHLAATCNVTAACKAASISVCVAYGRRRRDPVFAGAWRAALLTGYDVLEAKLLARAGAATDHALRGLDDDNFDAELALRLLTHHGSRMRAQATGTAKPQNRVKRATPEETDAAILKQLAALDRRAKIAKA